MIEDDPFHTGRDVSIALTEELSAAGFYAAEEIGRGGFGVVYRCTQSLLDRTVAVKVLTTDLGEANLARFFREQRAMGRLTGHPSIVNVLQVGSTDSARPYLVMPYYAQGSLEAQIRRHGPLAWGKMLRLGVKMAGALATAHHLDILHRDIKPANILIDDYGEPALTDFGIAHISGGFKTATGTVTGSPAFTAPEVLSGEPPSTSSDVYGLGATLFGALTGHAAFERHSGEQVVAQFLRITTQPVPDLRGSGVDDDVCAVVEQAMSRDPEQRPTAAALGEALRQLQGNHGLPVDEMSLLANPGSESGPTLDNPPAPAPKWSTPAKPNVAGNLPLELTSFVGRRTEVSEAKTLLSISRLLTLTGVGGVGKTRLALKVASTVRKDFPDGVWLVELGEVHDATLTESVVAAALSLRDQPARTVREVLIEFLRTRELLLVLDNCEQMVEGVAELVDTMLRTCPQVRILPTSREPLGIIGETVRVVAPLSTPAPETESSLRSVLRCEAVTLFAERAAAAVEGFEITDDNVVTVAQICVRLDGLPLAIELAAARLRVMSPDQILARLNDRFALLNRGSRGVPTRQRTLRWSIDWSHELCTPAEQRLWARLSVFAGTFGLDAAEDICGEDQPTGSLLDSLSALVDKSILIREEQDSVVRLRLLDMLRDYGREKLQEMGESLTLRQRHRNWYEQLALDADADWISSRQLEWISRLEREQPNLREAMEFCLSENSETEHGLHMAAALFQFTISRGLHSTQRQYLDQLLAKGPGPSTITRVQAVYAATFYATVQGDLHTATSLVEEGQALTDSIGDPAIAAYISEAAGLLALYNGDAPHARTHLETALQTLDSRVDLALQVSTLHILGTTYEALGDTARATASHEQALTITESHGEWMFRAYGLWALSASVRREGDRARAVKLLEQALRLIRQANNPHASVLCLEALAWIAVESRNAQRAAVLMGAAQNMGRPFDGIITVMIPTQARSREEYELSARHMLGERAFDTAYRQGSHMRFDAAVAYALGERPPVAIASDGPSVELTKRETQVADLVAQGLTNKAIAARLVISQRTAQGHVEHILTKLGYTSRSQIAAWVVEQKRQIL
ncbi:protein kinase (plasmid) [Rhodococcus erythropolis R138]|uniref:protein kinase domain-containing protein n=1 Tax=Rhodococcus erythropolis TaxID=1833 RepID=UPI00049256AF|nr:protein kinase [Rhodococcus erythropolis]ALU73407.1 protein kinase [Rhodococcus erythropolis R138]